MAAASASLSCDHFRSRRSSRSLSASARLILAGQVKRPWSDFVDYESIDYE